jgi:hypothetical protein
MSPKTHNVEGYVLTTYLNLDSLDPETDYECHDDPEGRRWFAPTEAESIEGWLAVYGDK